MTQERRVVITGMGAITPIGLSMESFWKGLLAGCSGVAPVTEFDCSAIATRIAAPVKGFEPDAFIDRKESKRMDRFVHFAVAASKMAVEDARLEITDENRDRVGVFIGSGIGGLATLEEQHTKMLEGGMGRVSPFFIPMMIANMGTGDVARILGAQGPSETVVTACATSSNALGDAFAVIQRGDADVIVAGGTEAAITRMSMAGFSNMRAMTRRNDDPEHASRPFDTGRDGFILGEGCGIVILEELETARARGAKIYAEMIGYGLSNDAYDKVHPAPEGAGAARAMRMALKNAAIAPESVGYVNAHGTSTPAGDVLEIMALKKIFGRHAYELAVSSTKSMTGHLLGAAGAIEAIATTLALHTGILPPTMNVENQDPECDLDVVPNKPREKQVEVALSNSFGFGGHNATLVLKRWQGN
jgi:3-oxoacyl-[acyl-carrier-protein] synthase II